MDTLQIAPDRANYQVDEGNTNVAVQLDGGAPRVRADQLGAVKTVTCQWTLSTANFDYMMAFYRTGTNWGSSPFLISLCGIDQSGFETYTAQFVPGSFKPIKQQSGLTYVISAQLWVTPSNDTSNDQTLITNGPSA